MGFSIKTIPERTGAQLDASIMENQRMQDAYDRRMHDAIPMEQIRANIDPVIMGMNVDELMAYRAAQKPVSRQHTGPGDTNIRYANSAFTQKQLPMSRPNVINGNAIVSQNRANNQMQSLQHPNGFGSAVIYR